MHLGQWFFFKRYAVAVIMMIVATGIAVFLCLSQLSYIDRTKRNAERLVDLAHAAQTSSIALAAGPNRSERVDAALERATRFLVDGLETAIDDPTIIAVLSDTHPGMNIEEILGFLQSSASADWAGRNVMDAGNIEAAAAMLSSGAASLREAAASRMQILQVVIFASAFLVLGTVAGVGFMIFGPMQREIVAGQRQAEDEKNRATTSERAKSEFLANMSHEIRTPMNGVMGMAELLAKTELDGKQKMFTDVIIKSAKALVTVINDILDFSKIDSGQLELDPQPFKLSEALEDVAALVSAKVTEKDLELAVRIQPDLPEAFVGDMGRVRQIVTNLVGNAVKFTDRGHVLVELSGKVKNDMADLMVRVEDTGIGIPSDKVDKVFEKFSQVDQSSTRRHEGTGLGLTISKMLVEKMDGEIGVESEVGKGSTFWFKLRLPVHGELASKVRPPVDVSGARVLVIDDNEINRAILLEQLGSWKFQAVAVPSGREGLSALRSSAGTPRAFDALILDYQMPGMDGADVAEAIRADPDIEKTPIVMLTSVDSADDGGALRKLGVQAHLVKPARAAYLLETVIGVLQDARAETDEAEETTRIPAELDEVETVRQIAGE